MRAKAKCEHGEGKGHDCAWVELRNSMIPAATAVADEVAGPEPAGLRAKKAWSEKWDAAYHRAMGQLVPLPGPAKVQVLA